MNVHIVPHSHDDAGWLRVSELSSRLILKVCSFALNNAMI